jgi:hypothetical protein
MSSIFMIGDVSILDVWGNFSKVKKFFEEDQYSTALRAFGDVATNTGMKSLERAKKDSKTRRENVLIAISQLQLAHEAYIAQGNRTTWKSYIPIAAANEYIRCAYAYEKACKVAQVIALAYRYIDDKTHCNEFLEQAIDNYKSSCNCRELAQSDNPARMPERYNPMAPPTPEEIEQAKVVRQLYAMML